MKPNNPNAFPIPPARRSSEFETEYPSEGMTLRDYFAAKAMQALIPRTPLLGSDPIPASTTGALSGCAYRLADAMLAEREKVPT